MKTKMNRYEKILLRPDGRRPRFVSELPKDTFIPADGLVLKIKVLTSKGYIVETSWTEAYANQVAKEKGEIT